MKKLLYISFSFLPMVVSAQFNLYKDLPLDYTWKYVGNAGFSVEEADDICLAVSPSGQPYVAYQDYENSYKATVMKFDGTNWVNVGNAGFSAGEVEYLSFAFSPSGQPYVAYSDYENSWKATAMKYDSVMVGINEQQESRMTLYPNPVADKITIKTSAFPTQSRLSITDLNGQELITRQITKPTTTIDISTLPSGAYFVRVTNEKTVDNKYSTNNCTWVICKNEIA